VIIPTFNCAAYLPEAIESGLAQTWPSREIVVVDDGSTDDTPDILRGYGERIRWVRQENRGIGGARNTGIRAAKGDLIAFLDADDVWLPRKLELQVLGLERCPEAALTFTESDLFDEHGIVLEKMIPNRRALAAKFAVLDPREGISAGWFYYDLLLQECMHVSSVLVRRNCLSVTGLFDESLPSGSEDYDLWLRFACRWPVVLVDQVLTRYRLRGGSTSPSAWRERISVWRANHRPIRARHLASLPALQRREPRRELADYLLLDGWVELQAGRLREARALFRRSVGFGGPAVRAARYWAASYLPAPVRQAIRDLRSVRSRRASTA
jgi:glycosyltransferase involved in cell wall biosynthesis